MVLKGCRASFRLGSTTLVLAVMVRRCLSQRKATVAMAGWSAGGVTVTSISIGALGPPVTDTWDLTADPPGAMTGTLKTILELAAGVAAAGVCVPLANPAGSVQVKAPVPAARLAVRLAVVLPAQVQHRPVAALVNVAAACSLHRSAALEQ